MPLVQGSFVPAGSAGFFFLWAHESEGAPAGKLPPVLPAEQLLPLLRGVPFAHTVSCPLRQPGAVGRPAKVPGIALSVATAVQWLLDLEAACGDGPLQPAWSLRAWSTAAKLLLELLGRGRFLPLLRAEAGGLAAGWSLAEPEPGDALRLAQVAAALPDVCRAIVPPDRDAKAYPPPDAGALLRQFLQVGADALAHRFLQSLENAPQLAYVDSATDHWLMSLAGRAGQDLPPGLPDAVPLYTTVESWAAPVTGVRGHGALRTGLRLNLPDSDPAGEWTLELVLQTTAQPPLVAPARDVWALLGRELVLGEERFAHAEQRILADLPAMVRLFAPLEALQQQPAPSRLAVPEEVVLALLEEGALLLQQADFPVHLPAELVRADTPRTRIHLEPVRADSPFGVAQLVHVRWALVLGGLDLTPAELQALIRQKRSLVQYQGRWVQVDRQAVAAALRRFGPAAEPLPLSGALRLMDEAESVTAEGWVDDLLTRLREPARLEPVPVPASFVGSLRPYQQRGLEWLAFLGRHGLGACLADDMGLGKTVQLIALLLHQREQAPAAGPTLLVCPVSLVGNWRRELQRFAPDLRVLIHHGTGRAGGAEFAAAARAHDVVITTYSLVPRDEADLAAVPWASVVADEAQNLKNPGTQHAISLRRLDAGQRIALTGTPVENHLGDLWSLFAFLSPGLLGSLEEFRRRYAIPIERYRDADSTARLRRLAGPFILRRLKTDPSIIDDLPEKLEQTVVTNLTVEQATLYEAVVQETLERADAADGIARHGVVLAGLTRLKQICNHPAAVTGDQGSLAGRSGKLERLAEMLGEVLAEGDRALIFTQFASFGARLQAHLQHRLATPVLFLDGSTPVRERERLIASFQAGEAPLFVLSLKAGGVGLNLTAANHVFHFDRWWNPAVEDQATDRAYRIGQTSRVWVHKLVTAGTLEERIDRLLAEKRGLSEQVISSGEAWLGQLSTDDLRELILLERE